MIKTTFNSTTVSSYFSNYNNVYVDKRIQRNPVWKKTNKQEYIASMLQGHCIVPFILCDVEACMGYCRELGEEYYEDYLYFRNIMDKGYLFISIDGNNRTNCLLEFIGGENYSPATFSEKQRKIYNSNICVVVIMKMTKTELHKVALNTNKGEPWNKQEQRNCIDGIVSDYVRVISEKMSKHSLYLSGIHIQRMGDDELYANFLAYHQFGHDSITKNALTTLYTNSQLNNEKEFEGIMDTWGKVILHLGNKGSKINKSFSFNLFVFLLEVSRKNRMVLKKNAISKFADEYERLEGVRLTENINPVSKKSYWSEKNRNMSINIKNKFKQIYSDFGDNLDKYFVTLDEKRLYTEEDKIMKYIETNGVVKTLDGGEENPTVLQAINSNLYHADHSEVPYSKGGPTTLENMQLLRKEDNLKKSNK